MNVGGIMLVLTYAEHMKGLDMHMEGTMEVLMYVEHVRGLGHVGGRNSGRFNLC